MIPDPGAGDPERDARLAAVYRTGAQQQPPEGLDDTIRAAARRAVAAGPRRNADRLRRWSVPLSLAAVVLLSVTLVTMMREEGVDRLMPGEPPSRIQPPVAAVDGPAQVPAQPAAPAPATPARQAAAPVAELQRPVPRAEMSAPEPRGQEHREMPAADAGSRKAIAEAAAPAEARQDSAPRAATAPRPLLRSAPASAPAASAETAAGAARSAAVPPATPQGLGAVSSAKAPAALWQDLEGEPAARWLDRLRELRKAGRAADADRLAAEFRRRFPDAALPDDLR